MHARNPKGYRSNNKDTDHADNQSVESGFVLLFAGGLLLPTPPERPTAIIARGA